MYIPAAFQETDPGKLFDLIQQYSFGLLVSQHDGEPFASHLPLLLDRSDAPHGCLVGHMARANPQWQQADGQSVLAIFAGAHAYISPTWYESDNVVPTWNYTAVHVYGTFRAIDDRDKLLQIVADYVEFYEATMPKPWTFDRAGEYAQKMAQAIVGFRIEISRIEGKWKLNQNHPLERQQKVIRALDASESQLDKAVASLMQSRIAGLGATHSE
ncbi:MAG TPA: FMN-binding negative transcriptional regulator [Planctomycetaceae bacterium]|jgi:transcriptional regulator